MTIIFKDDHTILPDEIAEADRDSLIYLMDRLEQGTIMDIYISEKERSRMKKNKNQDKQNSTVQERLQKYVEMMKKQNGKGRKQ